MKETRKWSWITLICVLVIGSLVALDLKYHYDSDQNNHRTNNKVQINNKNVQVFTDITYSHGYPNSKLDIITPETVNENSKLPIIFWMHGGGFVAGDKQYKNSLLSKIAEQGYVVVNVNYALAPNYKYPTPLKQMDAAVKFMKDNQHDFPIDFDQVILGGDSAGAQLMSQYTAMQTNDKLREEMGFQQQFTPEQLKGAIFFGGFYNMQTVRATEFPRIQMFMRSYTGSANWETDFKNISQMSTIQQVTKQFPPTYLSVGDGDPFYSQNESFIRKLKSKHVPTTTLFYDGTHHLHHQYQFHLEKPESKENMKRVLLFLSRNTSSSGVERGNNHSLDTHTPENNTVNLLPIE